MNKVIVTGAASGIGAAAAKQLRDSGSKVVGLDFNEPDGSLVDDFVQFDQYQYDSIDAAVAQLPGDCDALLNIAGVAPSASNTPERVMMINFYGLRHFTEQVLDKLARGAAIANLASAAGLGWGQNVPLLKRALTLRDPDDVRAFCAAEGLHNSGMGNDAAYPVSKQLVIVWTAQAFPLWQERGIRMNSVAPSAVNTPILADFLESFGADATERVNAIGTASPEEIARIAVMLIDPGLTCINGTTVPAERGAVAFKAFNTQFG